MSSPTLITSLDFSKYQGRVSEILQGSDLTSITAKQIRKRIQGEFHIDLSQVKNEFDASAIGHFQKFCEFQELSKTFSSSVLSSPDLNPTANASKTPTVSVKKEKIKLEYPAESLDSRQDQDIDAGLVGEFDYLPHRVTRGGVGTLKLKSKLSTKPKKTRLSPQCHLSPDLADLCGQSETTKALIPKLVWEYIKLHGLQDPSNKQYILCDEKLQKVCQTDRLYMFHLSRALAPHITILKTEKKDTQRIKIKKEEEDGFKTGGAKGTSKFNKLHYLSAPLQEIVGCLQDSRPQVTKKLWEYIKNNKLQDPKNGQFIMNDEKMQKVFKKKRMKMFEMAKLLGEHLFANGEIQYVSKDEVDEDIEIEEEREDGVEVDREDDERKNEDKEDQFHNSIPIQTFSKSPISETETDNIFDDSLVSIPLDGQDILIDETSYVFVNPLDFQDQQT